MFAKLSSDFLLDFQSIRGCQKRCQQIRGEGEANLTTDRWEKTAFVRERRQKMKKIYKGKQRVRENENSNLM